MKATQTELILAALLKGESLSQLEALQRFGCMRLGARILEIKKRGYDVEARAVSNGEKHFVRYRLRVPPPQLPPAFPPVESTNQQQLL